MSVHKNYWRKLFLFCLGLFAGTAFCMKWMEAGFVQNNSLFTIIGLEISYPKEKVAAILAGLDAPVKKMLQYHLIFDFAFMAAVYPGIAALCMIAREKTENSSWRKILYSLAVFQTVAWGCDILENIYLLNWINDPIIGNEFTAYHFVVVVKWVIALTGALLGISISLRRRKKIKTHFLI